MKPYFLIFILGPTGVGKTSISIFLAKRLKTEILSCDSRQFYQELKIGSYRPTIKELESVPHHFIGHLTIHQSYNAKCFEKDSLKKMKQLFKKYSILIMVGGSGLYEKSITEGLSDIPNIDLNIRNNLIYNFKKKGILFLQKEIQKLSPIPTNIDRNNPRRLIRYLEIVRSTGKNPSFFFKKRNLRFFSTLKIGLTLPREEIYIRINKRVEKMIQMGLLEEACRYYPYRHLNSLHTIGYKEIFDFLLSKKKQSFHEAIEEIKKNTRRYAKRQLTWYRKDPSITWFHPKEKEKIFYFILNKVEMGNTGFEPVPPCL
ncbi:tRNA delta(2)-isopentenylpyrophosphate transferase [Blattabacterium sp. (Periplaneta americana) str. BPLAN]|uniref:tRNA (adenosine(37)-N6)-dimethylallyltransferase MiaA n=1 Tax=Blattabacterium sp. (Periplaneta americana) TaxID=367488 RepID=UPI0001BA0CA6|nr:tRNA (adenosine(37)-N6)-dimethylallyltransferase MiaA [Blattabacterium sp. (Periplaneta americana)]ACX84065.1 tRNA delta(2)-isopentenylpyrophosphate transferase [Blattabacterium sp. (Periplaneta americana) str. BPLAN]